MKRTLSSSLLVVSLLLPALALAQAPPEPAKSAAAPTPPPPPPPSEPLQSEPPPPDTAAPPAPPSEFPPPSEVPPAPPVPPEPPPTLIQPPLPIPTSFGPPPPSPSSDPDWLFPGAITSLALGGAMMIGGAAAFGAVDGGEYCGINGCTTRPDGVPVNAGASLLGAGAGFVTVGGTSLLGWAVNRPEGSERRRNEVLMITGFAATTLGAAGLGLGVAQAATYDDRSVDFTTSWPLFLSSGVLLAGGIPVFVVGAFNESDADRARAAAKKAHPPRPGEGKHHSIPMAVTGAILTGIGGLGALSTTGLLIGAFTSNGYLLLGTIITEPVATAFSAVGVPLLVAGLHRDGVVPSSVPSFGAGPNGLTATWSLQ